MYPGQSGQDPYGQQQPYQDPYAQPAPPYGQPASIQSAITSCSSVVSAGW